MDKLIYEQPISFVEGARVENFLSGRTQYALIGDLAIFHGCIDTLAAIFAAGKLLDNLEKRGLDFQSLRYCCCFGNSMPEVIKVRHIYPTSTRLRVVLYTGGYLHIYDTNKNK